MKTFLKKRLPRIILLSAVAVLCLILYLAGVGCPWQRLFGVPCPGCGFTRAVIALLHLDFRAAFAWHPMVWSLPFLAVFLLCGEDIRSKWYNGFMLLIGAGFLLVWILRLL